MKIKKGTDNLFQQILAEMKGENTGEARFILQWTTIMEMRVEEGQTIATCAAKSLAETNNNQGRGINLAYWIEKLEPMWIYGAELKEWYESDARKNKIIEKEKDNSVWLSRHARQRLHQRCGLTHKAQDRAAKNAFQKGKKIEDTKGATRSYLSKVIQNTEDSERLSIRLYQTCIYVYKKTDNVFVLVTVMPLPKHIAKNKHEYAV